MAPSRHRSGPAFRPDVEGLRGLAVALVVLYHAGLGVAGGFIGVDVFFVLSGFLITGLLLREGVARGGRVSLLAFYGRRARRLVPAAVVVLLATVGGAVLLVDPLSRAAVLLDGVAAALSAGNIRFALAEGDYFATGGGPSPFLQFWSLGVEEQFYLVWPLLLIVALRAGRPRLAAAGLLVVVAATSFAANVLVTDAAPAWGFYSLPTRAWQLALGGLLAVAVTAPALEGRVLGRVPTGLLAFTGWVGLAGVAAAAILLDGSTLYPGVAALLPTLGAVALIAGGRVSWGPARLLATPPMRFLGRISYSLYLWHWPVLVLAPLALGLGSAAGEGPATVHPPLLAIGLVAVAVLLATATTMLVEEPIRFGSAPTARPIVRRARGGLPLVAGLTALVAVSLVSGGLAGSAGREVERLSLADGARVAGVVAGAPATGTDPSPSPSADPTAEPTDPPIPPTLSGPAAPHGEAAPRPVPQPSALAELIPTPTPAPTVVAPGSGPVVTPPPPGQGSGPGLPAGLQPSLARAPTDEERLKPDRCIAYEQATTAPTCSYGPADGFTIAMVGDSHASHLFPALEAVAQARGWRIVPFVKVSCPFLDLAVRSSYFKREYHECAAFRESTIQRIAELAPDLTLVAQNKWVQLVDPGDARVERVGASLARTLARIPGRKALIVDVPHAGSDVPTCLAAHPTDIVACATPRARAMNGVGAIEAVASRQSGVPTVDLREWVCVGEPCPAVVDGMVVYRDHHHLTATFSRSLAPALDALLAPLAG